MSIGLDSWSFKMNTASQIQLSSAQTSWLGTADTMRVAIAGSGGLAYWIAHYLSTETYHSFIILSRAVMRNLKALIPPSTLLIGTSPSRIFQPEGGKLLLPITRMDQAWTSILLV